MLMKLFRYLMPTIQSHTTYKTEVGQKENELLVLKIVVIVTQDQRTTKILI